MSRARLLSCLLAAMAVPATASAQDRDPFNLDSQAGFTFDFYPTAGGNVNDGESDAWDFCYDLTVDGTRFDAGGPATPWYDGRGFRTRAHDMGLLVAQRYAFVPAAGLSFARWIDVVENTGNADQIVTFRYTCDFGSDGDETNLTSDGDAQFEITDAWGRTDDVDGGGDPSLGHVFFGEGADRGLTSISYGRGTLTWGYDVRIPAGDRAAIMIFGIQQGNRALAESEAAQLAALQGNALEGVEDEIDDIVNFPIGPADGPRLRPNGPYRVDEGGTIQLGVEITDPDDDPVTWSWDFDGDGIYGDAPNVLDPTIDATDIDGPATLRTGIEMTDGVYVSQREVSVTVENVDPVVSSVPVTHATTEALYQYPIVATDFPGDRLTYAIEDGPAGMIVSNGGVLSWTPRADGRGPQIPVRVLVTDDDGGETEQAWLIDMHGGPIVEPGGPYTVDEGGEVRLAPIISDPEGDELVYAWDLDIDGEYDDSTDPAAPWSAVGIDGPAEGFVVHLRVSDGTYDVVSDIPVEVRNAPPVFMSLPPAVARIDRVWSYAVECVDPGGDVFEVSVDEDEMPTGMTFDQLSATLTWVPTEGALLDGQPLGTYSFTITAEDVDHGRSRQEVTITVGENTAPPVPPLKYPNGEVVHAVQPTILLDNVDDPEGDTVQYFMEVDYEICFCSPEIMRSGPLEEGGLVTSWTLPNPLNVDVASGGHTSFYLRRWSSDGLLESAKQLAVFDYAESPEGGDGDADADGDASDGDGASCACRTSGGGGRGDAPMALSCLAFAGCLLARRRSI